MEQDLSSPFWEGRYQTDTARWDIGQAAPPFVQLLESGNAPVPGRMVVLGMGRGHDALLFAERGFEVVGVDFAPSAIAAATSAANEKGLHAQFLERDIFDLLEEFPGHFDYVLEHTCFCAIDPSLRPAYVELVYTLLRPGGELIALFWAHRKPGGPPYGSTVEEIRELFSSRFKERSLELSTCSVPSRANEEYLARFLRDFQK